MATISVGFETGEGYADNDYLRDLTLGWENHWIQDQHRAAAEESGVDSFGLARVDTHTDHHPGQVVDHSLVGETLNTLLTELDGPDHEVEVDAYPDHMGEHDVRNANISVAGIVSRNAIGVMLRCQNNGAGSTQSCYIVRLRNERVATAAWESRLEILRVDALDQTVLALSANIGATYLTNVVHKLKGKIVGDLITASLDGVDLLTYDTSGDATKYTTGNRIGVTIARLYKGDGFNSQCFLDNLFAQDVAGGPASEIYPIGQIEIGAETITPTAQPALVFLPLSPLDIEAASIAAQAQPVDRTVTTTAITVTAGSITADPQAASRTIQPADAAIAPQPLQAEPQTAQRAHTAAPLQIVASLMVPTAQPAARSIQPATLEATSETIAPGAGAVQQQIAAAAIEATAESITPSITGPADRTITPASLTATASPIGATTSSSQTVTPSPLNIAAEPITTATAGPAARSIQTATLDIEPLTVAPEAQATDRDFTTAPLAIAAGAITATSQPVAVTIGTASLSIATLALVATPGAPTPIVVAVSVEITADTITASMAATPSRTIQPATMRLALPAISAVDPTAQTPRYMTHVQDAGRFLTTARVDTDNHLESLQ